jgi:protein phosphatase-4 regulatory subunit 3
VIGNIKLTILAALKFFRNLVGLQDDFYNQQMMQEHLFEPILDIVYETMPRDNLLNSACLEFFEFIIRRENIKVLTTHLVENYREKLKNITYVDTFSLLIQRYDQNQRYSASVDQSFVDTEEDTPGRALEAGGRRWQGVREMDAAEEEYFNTSDDDDETKSPSRINGASPLQRPLVDYPSDEEEMNDTEAAAAAATKEPAVPERLSEKRRREEDEEDELVKLSQQQHKRRNSSSSASSAGSSNTLRRKRSFSSNKDHGAPKKIAISLGPAIKSGGESSEES